MQINVVLPLCAYLILIFALSFYYYTRPRIGSFLNEYFVGNRSMGGFLLAMTLTTTYIGASSFICGLGAAYKYGLGWVLLSMIQLPVVWLSLGVLSKKLAILARRYNAVTLNDILYACYQSRLLVWLASLSLLMPLIGAMTRQFIGGAHLLEIAAGIPYDAGLLIFGFSTILYSAFGGFRASVLNDALQGLVMLIGTILLLIALVYAAGGLTQAVEKLIDIDPNLIAPEGSEQRLDFPFMASFWVLVCFGLIGLPPKAVRCIAYRDSKAVHQGMILSTIVVAILMLGMNLAGVLGRAVLPALKIPDQVIPTLMIMVLPSFSAGKFLATPLAAIMSTINAQLLQSSATIVKDLYLNLQPNQIKNERKLTYISSLSTLILGLLLLLTAWYPPEIIIWLNLLALGGLEVIFLWPLLLGLYWEKANTYGAISSMMTGGVCYTLLVSFNIHLGSFYPILPSLAFNLLAFYIGNQLGDRKQTVTP